MLRWTYSTFVMGCALAALIFVMPTLRAVQAAQVVQPTRIVVVGGALTEILYSLGEGDRIVGVDTTSLWPQEATRLPQVGYQRSLAAEGILSLTPDLVLVSADAGPAAVLQQIRDAGVRLEVVSAQDSEIGLLAKVEQLAAIVGQEAVGVALVERLRGELDALAQQVAQMRERPKVAFLLSVGRGSNLASGRDTAADAAIRLAGGTNALAAYSGYKPVNAEAMIAAAPEVLITTQRSLQELGGIDGLLALPGIALTPAGRAGRIEAMDALFLLGFGPRTPDALRELTARLHPLTVGLAGSNLDE